MFWENQAGKRSKYKCELIADSLDDGGGEVEAQQGHELHALLADHLVRQNAVKIVDCHKDHGRGGVAVLSKLERWWRGGAAYVHEPAVDLLSVASKRTILLNGVGVRRIGVVRVGVCGGGAGDDEDAALARPRGLGLRIFGEIQADIINELLADE